MNCAWCGRGQRLILTRIPYEDRPARYRAIYLCAERSPCLRRMTLLTDLRLTQGA